MKIKFMKFVILPIVVAALSACDSTKSNPDKNTAIYKCDGLSIKVQTTDAKTVVLSGMGGDIQMVRTESDAPPVFIGTNSSEAEIAFTDNDATATIVMAPNAPINCVKLVANPDADLLAFKSLGHEPEWNIGFDDKNFSINLINVIDPFTVPVGEMKMPKMTNGKSSVSFSYEESKLAFTVEQKICRDNMSGQYHLYTTTLEYLGKTYNGCGFSLLDVNQSLMAM